MDTTPPLSTYRDGRPELSRKTQLMIWTVLGELYTYSWQLTNSRLTKDVAPLLRQGEARQGQQQQQHHQGTLRLLRLPLPLSAVPRIHT